MSKYLHHLTMTTGHTRRSYRDEVDDHAIKWGRHAIATTRLAGPLVLPELGPDYLLHCTRETSKTLLCSLWRGDAVCVTFGVAAHSRHGAKLWRALMDTATTPIAVTACPPEPWVAARLELGAAAVADDDSESLGMIADLERCVGWAFLEMIEQESCNGR